jgi:thymidylate kinase/O-antigen/teichoic acid export membrane protein
MSNWLRSSGDGRAARLVAHLRTPLYGSAYALILSGVAGSLLGIVYWTLAARLFDAAQLGVNAAAISAMTFISFLAQLNMAGVLSRFIPTAGPSTRRLIALAYLAAGGLSAVGALVFVVWFAGLAGVRQMLGVDPLLAGWFVLATVAWSLFTIQDGALTGLRRTVWVPIENSIFGVIKIVLLVAFAAELAGSGIFASWTIPAVLLVLPVNWLIFRRFVPARVAATGTDSTGDLPPGLVRYLSGDYVGSLFSAAASGLMPLIVVSVTGARNGAYFFIAWTIAYSLYFISLNMATSLMVEGAARRATVAQSTLRMFRLMLGLQTLAVVVVVIGAPVLLAIFSPAYAAEAETVLRLLALAALPFGVNAIYLALARVRRQVSRVILVQSSIAVISLTASVPLLGSLGISGAGVAWLVAQSAVAAVVLVTQLLPLWRHPTAAGAGDLTALSVPEAVAGQPRSFPTLLRSCFTALDQSGIRWCLVRGGPDDLAEGARDVDLLVSSTDASRLETVLANGGLLKVVGHGRGGGGFFVGRETDGGAWVRLDVAVDLAFGRFTQLETGTSSGCLARRCDHDRIPSLAPDDAFWALVLHCVLDRGVVAGRHARRLQALVEEAQDDGPMGAFTASVLPAGWDPPRVRAAVRAGDWTGLQGLQAGILLRLWLRDPWGTLRRIAVRAFERVVGYGRLLRRRWGVSVALLGPDGAGKTTLAAGIAADFGLPVRRIYMGMWPRSQVGITDRIPVLKILVRPFAVVGKALLAEYHRAHGRLVIFDRYTYDALIPPRGRLASVKRPYFWILAHAAPAPQLVIVLDAPGETLFARKGESDPTELERDRRAFRALGARLGGATVVDATRPAEAIRAEVTALIWRRYLNGSGGA